MAGPYVVTTGHVTAETAVGSGRAVIDFFRGYVLPDDVPVERIETLLRLGHIAKVEPAPIVEPADEPDEPVDPDALPAGMSVPGTLAWVNGDGIRAQLALDAERAKDSPRATLVDRLEAVLAAE